MTLSRLAGCTEQWAASPAMTHSPSHTPSLSLTLARTLSLWHTHTHTHTLSLSRARSVSRSLSLSITQAQGCTEQWAASPAMTHSPSDEILPRHPTHSACPACGQISALVLQQHTQSVPVHRVGAQRAKLHPSTPEEIGPRHPTQSGCMPVRAMVSYTYNIIRIDITMYMII